MGIGDMECPVFRPTLEDIYGPFERYIEKIEKKMAQTGICKIVPPESWTPRRGGYPDNLDLTIERPIRQHATGSRGLYRALYIEQKPLNLASEFRPQALEKDNMPSTSDAVELERKYWKNITLRPPLYGADVAGSLFDEKAKGWNLRRLDTTLSTVLKDAGFTLPGVNAPYLYFGMWRSTFAWHTEDLDLYSVNFLHYGAPKQWYCIPPDSRQRFEGLIKGMLPDLFKACPEFFRHKELIISPALLDQFGIPYVKVLQHPREFVINYPGAYHAGFNHGYNCAESVNFATRRWIPIGAKAAVCKCNPDSVTIDMRMFRHLVPAKQLPAELFEDSTEDEDEDEEGSSGGGEGSSDEEEGEQPAQNGRARGGKAASSSGRGAPGSAGRGLAKDGKRGAAVGGGRSMAGVSGGRSMAGVSGGRSMAGVSGGPSGRNPALGPVALPALGPGFGSGASAVPGSHRAARGHGEGSSGRKKSRSGRRRTRAELLAIIDALVEANHPVPEKIYKALLGRKRKDSEVEAAIAAADTVGTVPSLPAGMKAVVAKATAGMVPPKPGSAAAAAAAAAGMQAEPNGLPAPKRLRLSAPRMPAQPAADGTAAAATDADGADELEADDREIGPDTAMADAQEAADALAALLPASGAGPALAQPKRRPRPVAAPEPPQPKLEISDMRQNLAARSLIARAVGIHRSGQRKRPVAEPAAAAGADGGVDGSAEGAGAGGAPSLEHPDGVAAAGPSTGAAAPRPPPPQQAALLPTREPSRRAVKPTGRFLAMLEALKPSFF